MMDHITFQKLVGNLYETVRELETMFPGRHFTPDGHMVGSLGECLVADAYDLELMTASNKGFDALSSKGIQIEIKATQSFRAAFRSQPEHAIVIKILPNGTFEEVFNGPGSLVWKEFENKPLPSNGQYSISLNKLKTLNTQVSEEERVPRAS
ncbi:MAG: hypothetical protein COA86_15065 [Kangiella sp.]|nr:MAG: hypothetical protein COA86_15065 [Kangiella sp.]